MNCFEEELERIRLKGNYRELTSAISKGNYIEKDGKKLLNLASNDYMSIASDIQIREEFLKGLNIDNFIPSYSSSRLLSGSFEVYQELEDLLARAYNKESSLIFNSGYHCNIGIIPAIADSKTLIIADKLIHASLIDGILLSKEKFIRYHHNDYNNLEQLIKRYKDDYEKIIIATESIFSMDGDEADIKKLVEIKSRYSNVLLYIDEAHAIGIRGRTYLGLAQEKDCIKDIDFLVGTFGKAIGSIGAFVVCKKVFKELLVNKMRSFIFSTSLPPINVLWTMFVFNNLLNQNSKRTDFGLRRLNLDSISSKLKEGIINKGYPCPSSSHIIPLLIGDSKEAISKAKRLQENGFYALAVRPPTVPEGTSRIRFSLNSSIKEFDINNIIELI
jgi:8-amino-7-oxononanoate synthase